MHNTYLSLATFLKLMQAPSMELHAEFDLIIQPCHSQYYLIRETCRAKCSDITGVVSDLPFAQSDISVLDTNGQTEDISNEVSTL